MSAVQSATIAHRNGGRNGNAYQNDEGVDLVDHYVDANGDPVKSEKKFESLSDEDIASSSSKDEGNDESDEITYLKTR